MGTCCGAHLAVKVRHCAPDAQNGAVTVTIPENPLPKCDYCNAPGEFIVSYYSK